MNLLEFKALTYSQIKEDLYDVNDFYTIYIYGVQVNVGGWWLDNGHTYLIVVSAGIADIEYDTGHFKSPTRLIEAVEKAIRKFHRKLTKEIS